MFSIVLAILFLLIAVALRFAETKLIPEARSAMRYGSYALIFLSIATIVLSIFITVPAGHNKVATLFGQTQDKPYGEGLHIVNPLLDFTLFDLRQKTHMETAGIPAEDKLITQMDVSVQYRTIGSMTPDILRDTGTTDALIHVHMIPKLRSILREQGKGIQQSQDFFKESVQRQLQSTLQESLSEFLATKGLNIEQVLIRRVELPQVIRTTIEETKKREQEVLKQEAELERFATEQEQKVKTAKAEFDAAKLEAQKIRELADAEAYKIDVVNRQLARSPNYIKLRQVEQWNGVLPVYTGGENIPMIDLRNR